MDATPTRPGTALLLLVRHGEAGVPGPGQRDPDRTLTGAGRAQVEAIARAVREAGWAPGAACASPYRRAQETLAGLGFDVPAETWAGLVPEADPRAAADGLARRLAALGPGACLLAVGHQPLIGQLVLDLAGAYLSIGTAHCAALERTATGWALVGHLDPAAGGTV